MNEETFTINGFNWIVKDIDQLSEDEVFIHLKDGDYEYKGIITGGKNDL